MLDATLTERQIRTTDDKGIGRNLLITIFDGTLQPKTVRIDASKRKSLFFGRGDTNDIVLFSSLVSREHGRIIYKNNQWTIEDKALYGDKPSENGLIYNNTAIISRVLCDGDFIRIDDGIETISEGVLFVISSQESESHWNILPIEDKQEIDEVENINLRIRNRFY